MGFLLLLGVYILYKLAEASGIFKGETMHFLGIIIASWQLQNMANCLG
jgi:hypothetical protein